MTNKLESLLRLVGRELANYQVCRFHKIPEEMQQTPCDFMGFTVTGRAILIEAKMVRRTSLPIGMSPGLSKHQWNSLGEANRAGAIALIVWAHGGTTACLSMDMAEALAAGRKSIPWSAIPPRFHRGFSRGNRLALLEPWLQVPDRAAV